MNLFYNWIKQFLPKGSYFCSVIFSVTETEYIPDKLHSAVNFFDNNHAVVRPCVKKFIRCESLFYGMLILILQSLLQMALL